MIHAKTAVIRGKVYRRTYSDVSTILRDGMEYTEAIDPIETNRTYTESGAPLELDDREALSIIVGRGADA